MFGDNSTQTGQVRPFAIAVAIATVVFIFGLFMYVGQSFRYSQVVKKSSSPIGTELTFNRSQAAIQIEDFYTDKSGSVMIIRLNVDENAQTALPSKGTDYSIFVSSKSTSKLTQIPVLFGRMSSDGDLYLIIPNVTKDVYSIYIMNNKYIAGSVDDDSSTNTADIDTGSLSQSLSDYQYGSSSNDDGTYTVQSSAYDVVGFRATLDPAFHNDSYNFKIIDANLLKTSSDGKSQEFDFETFFTKVFKEPAIESLNKKYSKKQKQLEQLNTQKEEYESRLAKNAEDTTASSALENTNNSISTLKESMEKIASDIVKYEQMTFSSDYFDDMQTVATCIKSAS